MDLSGLDLMPRKPKPPPAIKRIESLSTGRELRPEWIVDDFTGERVAVPQDMRPERRLMSGAELQEEANKAKLAGYKAVLIASGMGEWIGYIPPPKEQSLAYNQRKIKINGTDMVITVTNTAVPKFPRRM